MHRTGAHEHATEMEPLRLHAVNVGAPERWASVIAGAALALYGLRRGGLSRGILALAGGALVHRGATGHSRLYHALRIGTAHVTRSPVASVPHNEGFKIEQAVRVERSPEELYRFWRDFENLPRFMEHLDSVTVTGERTSHWVARGPAGSVIEWNATIHNERENELIAWRSLEGADVPNAGSVWFRPAGGGRETEVKVTLEYKPPAGAIGAAVAWLFGEDPDRQVREDLRRFKKMMESDGREERR